MTRININIKEIEELSKLIALEAFGHYPTLKAVESLDALLAFYKEVNEQEPVIVKEPDYHYEAMGCGLEDCAITDRYEAMAYGWDRAIERMLEQLPETPLYALPPSSATRIAGLEAEVLQWKANSRENKLIAEQNIADITEKLRIARDAIALVTPFIWRNAAPELQGKFEKALATLGESNGTSL